MKTKKFLSAIIVFIIISSPISKATRHSCNIFNENIRPLRVEDCFEKSEIDNIRKLVKCIRRDIQYIGDINKVKNDYYNYFKQHLFNNEKDEEKIQDIFTFFFSYTIVELISIELKSEPIDFLLLKNMLQYLKSEDMHFLFHAYIIANSRPFFSQTQIYVNHAIETLAKKGNEKPVNTMEDLIHKITRKYSNDQKMLDKLKSIYDEHLSNLKNFCEENLNYTQPLQKDILLTTLKIISNYKKIEITNNPIDLYNNYFKKAHSTANPR
ncbi:MAG: hypothetical protein IJJ04_03460 [Clostridia bacterium]|nr:hypothetical protein [Clostridia bacterium]